MRDPLLLPTHDGTPTGLLLSQLEEGRARTLRVAGACPAQRLHQSSPAFPNSVAAHLAHLGAIELDWLYCDLLGQEIPQEALAGCPIADVRDASGRLDAAEGASWEELLAWLEACRQRLLDHCRTLQSSQLGTLVQGQEGSATPEWILAHLVQHEAEHRGVLRRMLSDWREQD